MPPRPRERTTMYRPPISSPEEARAKIGLWLQAVEVCTFSDVQPRNPGLREAAVRNRRKALLAYGQEALRLGHIAPTVGLVAIEKASGINRGTILLTLEAEARLGRFLRVEERGQKAPNGARATRYKLQVNRLEDPDYFASVVGLDTPTVTPTDTPTVTPKLNQCTRAPLGALHTYNAAHPAGGSGRSQEQQEGSALPMHPAPASRPQDGPPSMPDPVGSVHPLAPAPAEGGDHKHASGPQAAIGRRPGQCIRCERLSQWWANGLCAEHAES